MLAVHKFATACGLLVHSTVSVGDALTVLEASSRGSGMPLPESLSVVTAVTTGLSSPGCFSCRRC